MNKVKQDGRTFVEISDLKMGVNARQMEQDERGKLRDRKDQNVDHKCQKFAKDFTDHYAEISEVFPVFKRLK